MMPLPHSSAPDPGVSPKEYEELRKNAADLYLAELDKRFFAKSAEGYAFVLDVLCSRYFATIVHSRMLNLRSSAEANLVHTH
jgi:hypothetical protein